MPQRRSKLSDFESLGVIGKGSYGSVSKVRRKIDKRIYVIKTISLANMTVKEKDAAVRECQTLADLNCEYIIRYYDSFIEDHSLHIVTEYAQNGDLQQFIQKSAGKPIPEKIIWSLFIQMVLALHHIHGKRYLHRDFKSLNVFLDANNKVKVGDLGVARKLNTDSFASTMVGTPYYLSPELCENVPYNAKSDIWALANVGYELCTGKHPFTANNQAALVLKIIRGAFQPIPSTYSRALSDMITKCLSKDPAARPSTDELLARPTLRSYARRLGVALPPLEGLTIKRRMSAQRRAPAPTRGDRPPSSRVRRGTGPPTPLKVVAVDDVTPPRPTRTPERVARPPPDPEARPPSNPTPTPPTIAAGKPVTMSRLKASRASVDALRLRRDPPRTPSPDLLDDLTLTPTEEDGVFETHTVEIKLDPAPSPFAVFQAKPGAPEDDIDVVEMSFEETLDGILRAHRAAEDEDIQQTVSDDETSPGTPADQALQSLLNRQESAERQARDLRRQIAAIVPDEGQVKRLYDFLRPICTEQRQESDEAINRYVFGIISYTQTEAVALLYQLISAEQDAADLAEQVGRMLK